MTDADEVAADLFASRLSSGIIAGTTLGKLVTSALAVAYMRGELAGRDAVLSEWRKHLSSKELS